MIPQPADHDTSARQHRLAVFDVDGTLTATHSCIRFLLRHCGSRRTILAALRAALSHHANPARRDEMKLTLLHALLKGQDTAVFRAAAERYACWLETRLDIAAVARLRKHQQQGHLVLLVSAALAAYLHPLGARLGVNVAAVEMTEANGVLTGMVEDGINLTGQAKVSAVQQFLAECSITRSDVEVWVYGDSTGDADLLQFADHPVRVRLRYTRLGPWRVARARAANRNTMK